MTNAQQHFDWVAECGYICMITDAIKHNGYSTLTKYQALRNFNGDVGCFVNYCEMQRDAAQREGHHDSATYIQECLDDLSE